jgi:predicted nucleic acid-binding protein
MNAYLDSSVVLRRLQREAADVPRWGNWEHAYSSELLRIEVLRSINRNRLKGALEDDQVAELITVAHTIFDAIEFVELGRAILNRASQSFLTPLGTLDALHLATALRLTESSGMELTFLTHDTELATAARTMSFKVEGA